MERLKVKHNHKGGIVSVITAMDTDDLYLITLHQEGREVSIPLTLEQVAALDKRGITGKIVIKEQLFPFNDDPCCGFKEDSNGDVCFKDGTPIYSMYLYTDDSQDTDVIIESD